MNDILIEKPHTKHAGLGIASFTVSILALTILAVNVSTLGVLLGSIPDQGDRFAGFGVFVEIGGVIGMLTAFFGAFIGTAGLFQKDRKRLFAILGLIISLSSFVATYLIIFNKTQP